MHSALVPATMGITRVMSPSGVHAGHALERWGLRDTSMICEVCNRLASELWVCSACYRAGHPECLQMSLLDDYAFCSNCKPWAIEQHSRQTTEAQKERWRARLAGQLANWRAMTVTATGVLGTVGIALGGVGAMVLGGTAALVQGAVEG